MPATGPTPVPVTVPVSGLVKASLVTVSVPPRVPMPCGVKLTVIVQLPPGGMIVVYCGELGQFPVASVKSPRFGR